MKRVYSYSIIAYSYKKYSEKTNTKIETKEMGDVWKIWGMWSEDEGICC